MICPTQLSYIRMVSLYLEAGEDGLRTLLDKQRD